MLFHYEHIDWNRETGILNSREYERTIRVDIAGLINQSYSINAPVTCLGVMLMSMIKAATDPVHAASQIEGPGERASCALSHALNGSIE